MERKTIFTTGFNLNMLPSWDSMVELEINRLSIQEVIDELAETDWESCVFRDEHAAVLSKMLGMNLQRSRRAIILEPHVSLIVAQYIGPLMRFGETDLPPAGRFSFYEVRRIDLTSD
jgi:hypothetical protein